MQQVYEMVADALRLALADMEMEEIEFPKAAALNEVDYEDGILVDVRDYFISSHK